MEIIDVSFRESVYTDTIFQYDDAEKIIKDMVDRQFDKNGINYIELGYIDIVDSQIPLFKYNAQFIKNIKNVTNGRIKLSAMVHIESFKPELWDEEVIKLLDMVRIVVNGAYGENMGQAIDYFHRLGVKVSVNCAYISRRTDEEIVNMLKEAGKSNIDIFFIADTNGSMFPEDISRILTKVKKESKNIKIGFHAHNHFQLATANFIEAYRNKVDFIDSSICGYGKGAGNLKTELAVVLLAKLKNKTLSQAEMKNISELATNFKNYLKIDDTNEFENVYFAYKNLKLGEINKLKEMKNKGELKSIYD